ncbi:MAG: SDR family NAD(P)-dependent oxidoreductase, partial [Planctomycetota bacterium]
MTLFSNRTVMVTGASRGIGKAIVYRFAEQGAHVVVHFHQQKQAAEQALNAMPGKNHLLVQADLADPDATRCLMERAIEHFGKIDVGASFL